MILYVLALHNHAGTANEAGLSVELDCRLLLPF